MAYAAGWGAIIPDDKLGPLAFLVPKEKKRPSVLQVINSLKFGLKCVHKILKDLIE